jgi:hypothetical protein
MEKAKRHEETMQFNRKVPLKSIYEVVVERNSGRETAYYVPPGGYREIEEALESGIDNIYFSDIYGDAHVFFKRNLSGLTVMALNAEQVAKILS